jgi:hypothetical protein
VASLLVRGFIHDAECSLPQLTANVEPVRASELLGESLSIIVSNEKITEISLLREHGRNFVRNRRILRTGVLKKGLSL